ncbi:hypothetical protein, partial [Leucobacter sp. M11]|uniref:hypothetical protein n=1 Tax=Leucobacter sp. M11 TaxID=2993565 RepID=UPI002D801F88
TPESTASGTIIMPRRRGDGTQAAAEGAAIDALAEEAGAGTPAEDAALGEHAQGHEGHSGGTAGSPDRARHGTKPDPEAPQG